MKGKATLLVRCPIACCVALVSLLDMFVVQVNKSHILLRLRSTGHVDIQGKAREALRFPCAKRHLGPSSTDIGEMLHLKVCDCLTSLFPFLHCCCCNALSLSFWNFFDFGRLVLLMGILTVGFLLLFIVAQSSFNLLVILY